jgi:inward rectifier potassium channel
VLKVKNNVKEEYKDLGFGTKAPNMHQRLVNPDGSFNIERRGAGRFRTHEIYHNLITMPWRKFMLMILADYIVVNILFAVIYLAVGVDQLGGMDAKNKIDSFLEAWFFSAQTFTTVGYGGIHPTGHMASFVASIESLCGLLAFALATGLLYGRFSRPMAKVLYSQNAIIAPYHGISAFEFRIVNMRSNQLIEVEVQVMFSRVEIINGEERRQYYPLELERNKINFFPSTWTIVHPITENSPLVGETKSQLIEEDAEFMVLIKAFDDTFSQTVYSRSSYRGEDIVVGAKFVTALGHNEKGVNFIDLDLIDEYEAAPLPEPVSQTEINA